MKTLALILSLFYSTIVYGAVLTLDDYAASETSIYDHLNDNIDKMEAVLNGGLEGDNLKATFAVGSDQVGANAIGSTQMQDYSIGLLNMQTDSADARVIVDDSITADDINSEVEFDDVFPENKDIYWNYQSGTTFSTQWKMRCFPNYGTDYDGNLYIQKLDDDGINWTNFMLFDVDSNYVGISLNSKPKAQLDIAGTLRVKGQAEFESGIANAWTALAENDRTPNVKGGNNFYTANTGTGSPVLQPITYTNFNGGVTGQRILVRVMDIFSIFSYADSPASSLWTQDTSADWGALSAAEQGVIYEFQKQGNNWYCLNRYGPFYQGTAGGGTPPSFGGASEDWESGGFTGGAGWATSAWVTDGNVRVDDGSPHAGTYAARLYYDGADMYRGINTSTGTATISLWAKNHDGTPTLHIYDSDDASSWTELTSKAITGGYQKWEYTWTMANKQPEYIKFDVSGPGAEDRLWIDDITIE